MGTSVAAQMIDAIIANAPANLPAGVAVFDGFGVTDDPVVNGALMVGCDDPDTDDWTTAVDTSELVTVMATTRPRDEEAEIPCVAMGWSGNSSNQGAKEARDIVFGILAGVADMIRTAGNPTPFFGVTGAYRMDYGTSGSLMQKQTDDGATAYAVVRIAYKARI